MLETAVLYSHATAHTPLGSATEFATWEMAQNVSAEYNKHLSIFFNVFVYLFCNSSSAREVFNAPSPCACSFSAVVKAERKARIPLQQQFPPPACSLICIILHFPKWGNNICASRVSDLPTQNRVRISDRLGRRFYFGTSTSGRWRILHCSRTCVTGAPPSLSLRSNCKTKTFRCRRDCRHGPSLNASTHGSSIGKIPEGWYAKRSFRED